MRQGFGELLLASNTHRDHLIFFYVRCTMWRKRELLSEFSKLQDDSFLSILSLVQSMIFHFTLQPKWFVVHDNKYHLMADEISNANSNREYQKMAIRCI